MKISGFKNLIDVDIHFGPFTCIAGPNGVGKSNLFDAIRFLGALADRSLLEAALVVRDENGKSPDVRSLFHRVGDAYENRMSFEIEMIIPAEGFDDLGQRATASISFLSYSLCLGLRDDDSIRPSGSLEILSEKLAHINLGDAGKHLLFKTDTSWRRSVLRGRRTSPFISTEGQGAATIIKRHQDGRYGRPSKYLAADLPKTVLSASTTAEFPTAMLARKEMLSWRFLQLEPSALRRPDEFNAPGRLGADGSHLPSTLYHLAHAAKSDQKKNQESVIFSKISNRLAKLIDDVQYVWLDKDDKRELLTLFVTNREGTPCPARSLSDGTLRFLALAVLELDFQTQGLICFEEPENGIHPARIPAMLELLQDIAVDVNSSAGPDNALRQVIVNTHSPVFVSIAPESSLLVAELKQTIKNGQSFLRSSFGYLPNTWRDKIEKVEFVSKGKLISYLNPVGLPVDRKAEKEKRIRDRNDLQLLLPNLKN
jgi:predicted ATPase